jgi:hypothetical protein
MPARFWRERGRSTRLAGIEQIERGVSNGSHTANPQGFAKRAVPHATGRDDDYDEMEKVGDAC